MVDIYTLDGLNGVSNVIDTFESLIWNMQYFGSSDFELNLIGSPKNIQLLQPGTLLVRDVDMSNGVYKNVMVVENRKINFDVEKGWMLQVTGRGLKRILGQRVVWTQTNLSGTVESGIRQVITENAISPSDTKRTIPNFTLAASKGYADTFEVQLFGENLAEWIESVCQQYGYGWDIYIDNGDYIFDLYQGTDRTYDQSSVVPVVFSPEFDNLLSASYTYEKADYKNVALVGGEGEGTDRRTASVGIAAGLDRYETYVDGSTVSSNGEIITLDTYLSMLQNYGKEQLANAAFLEKYEGEIIPSGMYTLNENYYLGDIVQISNGLIQTSSRIIEIIYSEDENGTSLVPTFSDWEEE